MELTASRIADWLTEDVGAGDATTDALVPEGATCTANLLVKERGVVCGLAAAESVFRELDPDIQFERLAADGDLVDPGSVARIEGSARAILTGERTALNLLGRLSGIATLTRRYVDAVEGTGTVILDTRKTTPGLRALQKEAVRAGGGANHRYAAADRILLDNMSPAELREAVELVGGRAETEASGGVTLDTVRAIAETGVDFVSVGALTHSALSLDVSLEVL